MSLPRPVLVAFTLALGLFVPAVGACDALDAPGAESRAGAAAPGGAASSSWSAGTVPDTIDGAAIDLGHTLGRPDAPIAVVEFSDFGCPYCARFARTTLPRIMQDYIDAGLVRWRYVPVIFGFAGGELMGAAAECAADQGGAEAFWRAHDLFYSRQTALRGEDARPRLLDWMAEQGLDRDRLDACIDAPATRERLQTHNLAAQGWFVRGTPSFVVNGVPMSGAMPYEFFRMVFATVLDPSGL
jgi:protein-disulfide isomerase